MSGLQVPILWIRGHAVILDSALAELYGVETRRLNEQVKRNRQRFPEDFAFQLTSDEKKGVIAKCDNPSKVLYFRGLPTAFTEHGALMVSMVLSSPQAAQMSIFIMRAFVQMRKEMSQVAALLGRVAEIEHDLLRHDEEIRDLYEKLIPFLSLPSEHDGRAIGFQPDPEV